MFGCDFKAKGTVNGSGEGAGGKLFKVANFLSRQKKCFQTSLLSLLCVVLTCAAPQATAGDYGW